MYFLRNTKNGSFFATDDDINSEKIIAVNEKGEKEKITAQSIEIWNTSSFMAHFGTLKENLDEVRRKQSEFGEGLVRFLLSNKELGKEFLTKMFGTDELPLIGKIETLFSN